MADDPREVISVEDWFAARLAEGDGPVEPFRMPWGRSRLLLLAGHEDLTLGDIARCLFLSRWGARQDRAGVRDGRVRISCGFAGVTAFTKRGVLRKAAAAGRQGDER